jgi:putative ABC transport system substrate-binding protein
MRFRPAGLAVAVLLAVLCVPLAAEARLRKVARIGVLVPAEPESPTESNVAAFRQALRELGYIDGQTIAVEYRYARGRADLYSQLVAELIGLHVDVMVIGSVAPAVAAKKATQTIPIVGVAMGSDPVRFGLAASLARPGGNVTGSAWVTGDAFRGKWLERLKEADPGISRVGYLRDPSNPARILNIKETQAAATALGLKFQDLPVSELRDLEGTFARFSSERGGALFVPGDLLFMANASQITRLATIHRLPAIYGLRAFIDAGSLMMYGPSLADLWRRAAIYVDKILKGAKPADLPIEQPTKFELIINLKTAKALGLTIPQSLMLRADQMIE